MDQASSAIRANVAVPAENTASPQGRYRVWTVDPTAFSTSRIGALRHNFNEHPLMQLPELAQLAKNLFPTKQCRFIAPGTKVTSEFDHGDTSYDGRSIDDVFQRIEEPGSWVALYNVETDPKYREFLSEVTACVRALVDREQPGMFNVGGFIFISAPPSVTPFHIDRENNFWLQIAGRKTMNVWNHTDRVSVPAPAVEAFIMSGTLSGVKLRDELRARSLEFNTGPGDGIYFPSTSPHMTRSERDWVKPGDGVSISIGVTFYTDVTREHAYVHAFNRLLRRTGLSPTLPGQSRLMDTLKHPLGRAAVWAMKQRGYEPRAGF